MRVEKCFFDLNTAVDSRGYYTALEIPYLVFEVEDEITALNAVRNAAEKTIDNLVLKNIEMSERINQNIFKVNAVYEPLVFETGDGGSDNNEPSFNFDTGGGTKHITQSLQTIGKFPATAPGEVLFLGASGSRRGKHSSDYWEITFKFAVSPNTASLRIGTLNITNKKGWDYLWVRYADDVSTDRKALIKKPVAAYVEKVYEQVNFNGLGIGS